MPPSQLNLPRAKRPSHLPSNIYFFCRAVQAGKGPAPRNKGFSVGDLRDAALRHLRGVLVTYAILTIQNPEMWDLDVSSFVQGRCLCEHGLFRWEL